MHSFSGLFRSTGFRHEKFLPWFLCFKLRIFPRGDSRKSFSHPCLNEGQTIPATVKKLLLSLAFSDLAVGLLPQLMTPILSAVMLKMASSGDDLAFFCPTVLTVLLYFMYLLAVASFLNVTVIAFDRVLVFRSTCDIRSLSRPNVLQWCWCLYG